MVKVVWMDVEEINQCLQRNPLQQTIERNVPSISQSPGYVFVWSL